MRQRIGSNLGRENELPIEIASGCLGALLIYPLLYVFALLFGIVFGFREPRPMSPTVSHGPMERGIEGGFNSMVELLLVYVFTVGIAPLIILLAGVGIGVVLSRFVGTKNE